METRLGQSPADAMLAAMAGVLDKGKPIPPQETAPGDVGSIIAFGLWHRTMEAKTGASPWAVMSSGNWRNRPARS
jgi:hypothetical protein